MKMFFWLFCLAVLTACTTSPLVRPSDGRAWYAPDRRFFIDYDQYGLEFVCGNEYHKESVWIGRNHTEWIQENEGRLTPVRIEQKLARSQRVEVIPDIYSQCAFGENSPIGSKVILIDPDWIEMKRITPNLTRFTFRDGSYAVLNYPLMDADRHLLVSAGVSPGVARSLY